jgi:hypothetical protein
MRRIECCTAVGAIALAAACGGDASSRNGARVDTTAGATPAASAPSAANATDTSRAVGAAAAADTTRRNGSTISFRGLDSLRVGETIAALERATGEKFAPRRGEDVACRYVRPKTLPSGMKVMVVNDTVVRLDVDSGTVVTEKGIGVGSADSAVRTAYGSALKTAPNKYAPPPAGDLIVTSPDDTLRRIVFESDGAKVKRYRVGLRPAVDFVEGCG